MIHQRFDALTRTMATGMTRRKALVGLGGASLASVGLLAARQDAAAGCHQQCRRRCGDNRGPKCQDRCEKRRCG